MSNPYEYKEIMAAAMQFGTTKTVDEVIAEHRARHEQSEREAKNRRPIGSGPQPQRPTKGAPAMSEIEKVRAMIAAGQGVRTAPITDVE